MTTILRHLLSRLLLLGFITVFAPAQTPYRDIALDCGGWVSGFAQHPSGRLYGFGDIFGLYRSDDFGATWHFLQNSLTKDATFVAGVTVHPNDANRVAFTSYGTTWTSTDGGESWTQRLGDVTLKSNNRGSRPIVYHPTQASELWLASPRSGQTATLWRSNDNGASWSAVGGTSFANEEAITIYFFPSAPNEVWVGTRAITGLSTTGGLWCSTNGGSTWTKVWNNGGAATQYYGAPQVNSIARNASRVSVFATNTGTWRVTATDWNAPQTYSVTQATFANQSVNVHLLANGSFWTGEGGDQTWAPKISTDGIAWTDRQITLTAAYVPEWTTAALITSANRVYGREQLVQDVTNPNRWLLTGGASAHLSEDNGLTWRYQPGGMAGIAGWRTTFDRINPNRAYLATSDRGIFVVTDGGLSGQTASSSRQAFDELQGFHEALVSADGQTIVGAGVSQGINRTVIIRSTDGGANWAKLTPSGLPDSYEGVQRAVMSLNDPNDYLVLLGYTEKAGEPNNPGLYRTTNGGTSFNKVMGTTFDGLNTGMRYDHFPSFLDRDGINANIRYLALRAGNNSFVRGVWRSTDGGTNWTLRTDPFGGQWIWAFAVDPTLEGRLWVGGPTLRRSDDGGGSWTTVANFVDVRSIDAYAGRLAVLGRRTGDTFNKIYISADHGTSWQEQTSDKNRMIWAKTLAVDPWRPSQTWLSGSRSWQIFNPPTALDPILTGTVSGSAPANGDTAFAADKAYDANTTTAFAPAANGGFTQRDLGASQSARVTALRFFPRAGFESRMNGGRFEGSANGSTWTTLHSLTASPAAGWQTATVNDTNFYRYLRYIHPTALADVAEIEFRGLVATTPVILHQPLPVLSGLVGQALTYTLSASGTPSPTFAITSGTLPTGLALNATTGLISGTPSVVGSGTLTVQATNFKGSTTTSLTLNVVSGPRLTASAPAYTQLTNTTATAPVTLTNTGDAPLSWAASLPTVDGNYILAASTTAGSGVTYDWLDAVTGGTKLSFSNDDDANTGPVTLPFTFPFYGTDRTSLRICTNGWASFTSVVANYNSSGTFPNNNDPENIIAPFFTDLYLRTDSGVYYRAVDAQTFVISYIDLVRYVDRAASNPARFSFQIVLKSDGRIYFQYQKIPNLSASTRLIGIQNATRTLGTVIAQPSTISDLTGRAYLLTPPLGWLAAITPASSSAAGSTLAAGASITLNATINTTGIATGQTRSANITFTSNDPVNPTRLTAFNLTVGTPVAPSAPVITASQSTTGVTGTALSYQIQASASPTSYALASGSLPTGVTLNTNTGLLSGTPTTLGTYTPNFTATNATGTSPAVAVSIVISAPPLGTDYTFNTSQADFEAAFNETSGWGTLWDATAGTGASGGLATDSNDRAALLPASTITFTTAGQSAELSVSFKARVTTSSGTNTAGGESLSLGLNRVNTPLLVSGGYLVAGVSEASSNSLTSALASASRNNTPGTVTTTDTNALTLVENDWYALDATITYNGANAFTVTCSLYSLGASGTANPVLLDTYTVVHTGLDSLVGIPLYAGFQGRSASGTGGVRAFDDFYAGLPSALATFRTTNALAANGSQDTATPAGDSVPNLLKYAFNMLGSGTGQASTLATPNASVLTPSGSAGLPFVSLGSGGDVGKLQLTFIRRKATSTPGVSYTVEFSDALATWAVNPSATESVTSLDATFERVTVNDSLTSPAKRFVRVKVTAN